MDLKAGRRKMLLFRNVFGAKDKNASSRTSIQRSINSTVDFRGSPAQSPMDSSLAPSSSFFKSLSESRSLKFSSFSSPASTASTHAEAFRIFTATWNVGGKTPDMGLNLNDFLPSDDHSDIYVLGFQEVVPLNAGNVLVIEDNEPAARWLTLINRALNRPSDATAEVAAAASCSFSQSADTFISPLSPLNTPAFNRSPFRKPSLKEVRRGAFAIARGRRLKSCTCPVDRPRRPSRASCLSCSKDHVVESDSTTDDEDVGSSDEAVAGGFTVTDEDVDQFADAGSSQSQRYCLVACKQMVGLFVTVWVRRQLVPHVGHARICCVGRGIMGYLGNKGCISVSMSLHQTSLCFVCSHLASGEKEGDGLKRNSDVVEILKHTQFRRVCKRSGRRIPERILEHDRVIWLGDLNYRIALSYSETKKLVEDNNWDALFEKDQLKIEIEAGVFEGWNEGKIFFAPTYKYSYNSDSYAGEDATSKKKRRTPAWCDRILWHGEGIAQVSYIRGELKFSDHRPVCAVFIIEVGVLDSKVKKAVTGTNMKVGAEELLPRNGSSIS